MINIQYPKNYILRSVELPLPLGRGLGGKALNTIPGEAKRINHSTI